MANTTTSYDRANLVQGQTSTGIRVPLLVAADGTVQTASSAGEPSVVSGSLGNNVDSVSPTTTDKIGSASYSYMFNGTSYDRQRGNVDTAAIVTLTTQAAGTVTSADQINYNGRGVKLGINITAQTGTVTVSIQGKDIASGQYYAIGATTALAIAGFNTLTVYPGSAVTANISVSDIIPRTWRVQVVVGTGGGVTGTIGASVIL